MELTISDYIQVEDAINIRFGKDNKMWHLNTGNNVLCGNLPSNESIPPLVSTAMFYHKNKSLLVKLPVPLTCLEKNYKTRRPTGKAVFAILHEKGLRTNLQTRFNGRMQNIDHSSNVTVLHTGNQSKLAVRRNKSILLCRFLRTARYNIKCIE
jgi:hypothetical protein